MEIKTMAEWAVILRRHNPRQAAKHILEDLRGYRHLPPRDDDLQQLANALAAYDSLMQDYNPDQD